MTTHPYLRAYMAGVTVPSIFFVLGFAAYLALHASYDPGFPVERFLVFPLALVPAIWGAWNMVYVAAEGYRRWPIGLHGAMVPLVLLPPALWAAGSLQLEFVGALLKMAWLIVPLTAMVYYLVWKYFVGALNRLVGIGPA
ncbi:MAG: hypothetical protein JST11_22560 [Acidobacteria bacterium]|nr:hypothetical protein [Acidobacteriota bacterium]